MADYPVTVNVPAGQTVTVTKQVPAPAAGTHTVSVLGTTLTPVQFTVTDTPPVTGLPEFGISEALGDGRPWNDIMRQLDEDVSIGAQYIRNMVDPDWGQWILDIVSAIEERGMELMAILTPSHPGGQGNDYSSPADAAAYMTRELAFIPNCRIFELENEVNQLSSGWSTLGPAPYNTGSARDGGYNYGLACIAMYNVLKAAKPDSVFVAGALGGGAPHNEWCLNWIRGIYDSGCRLGHGFDAFSLHLYCDIDDWNNDWYPPVFHKTAWYSSTVRSIMEEEYGDYGVPIISTESGEASSFRTSAEGPAGGHNSYFSEATQARIYGHMFDHLFGVAHPAGSDAGGPWQAYDGMSAPIASFCAFTMPDDSMYRQNPGYNNPDGYGLIRLNYSRKPSWQACRARMTRG